MPRLYPCLERNIVFHVVEVAALLRRGGLRRRRRPRLAAVAAAPHLSRLPARLAAALAPSQHLHGVAADFGAVAVLAGLLVLPLARAQAALDVHLRAFLEVLAGDFRQAAEEGNAVPLGLLLHLAARLVLPAVGGGDADVGDRLAAGQIAGLGVCAEVADNDHLVHRCHLYVSLIGV